MRIIIADDHIIFRQGLKLLLQSVTGYQVIAEAGDAPELKTLVQQHQPDLVILDYNMPGGGSGDVLAYLKQRYPAMRRIMLTAERSGVLLKHLVDAGADGILLKEGSAEQMLAAIKRVMAGQQVLPDNVLEKIEAAQIELTAREFQVLQMICAGHANAEIAERFALSVRTVDKHRENLLRKLGVNNVVQLLHRAQELRLFESKPI